MAGHTKLLILFALTLGLISEASVAQQTQQLYPSKPMRLIIGFPPGGGADAVARPIAEALSKHLGQAVVVDNKPGGGTTIAAAAAATAPADGHTLFMHNSSHLGTLQTIYKQFKHQPGDYTAISRWTTAPLLLAVSVGSEIQNVPELIKRAKAAPDKLDYASPGVGGGTHLPGLLFTKAAGVDIVHVPYKGSEAAPQGVAPEETQLTFATPPSALSLAKANKLKIIAVTSANRSPLFPELPTVAEGGASGYEYSFWLGLLGPPVLPSPIVQRLFDASQAVLRDPELVKRILARSNEVVPSKSFSPSPLGRLNTVCDKPNLRLRQERLLGRESFQARRIYDEFETTIFSISSRCLMCRHTA